MKEYTVYVTASALTEIKDLPGNMRQRVRRAIDTFADDPRPAKSKAIDVEGLVCEVRRLRLEKWRVVYAITESELVVDVLAVRKRPPYDYGDLDKLLEGFPKT